MSQALPTSTQLLQQRYRDSLPLKHAELSSQWQLLLASPDDSTSLSKLQQMLHRLAGSAGAYGYTAIGDLARDADALIVLRRDPLLGESGGDTLVTRLDVPVRRLLDQLADEFQTA